MFFVQTGTAQSCDYDHVNIPNNLEINAGIRVGRQRRLYFKLC